MITNETIQEIARAWIRYNTSHDKEDEWVLDPVGEWISQGQLDATWRLVLALCSEVHGDDLTMIGNIGAGPVEEFIVKFGDAALDLIEPSVAANPILLRALAMVWGWEVPERTRVDRILEEHNQQRL